jgi:serine/threonine protein kinase
MAVNPRQTHPTAETLTAFAQGRLEEEKAMAVAEHLDGCSVCQAAVLAVPDDALFALLQDRGRTPVPHPGLLGKDTVRGPAATPPELIGHPRYRLLERLGAGGMGEVFKAEHRLLARAVALKIINKQLTSSAAIVERFRREMRAVARLSHPNLVQAHDAEQAGELHFLVMEFVDGISLAALVERDGPFAVALACDCIRQASLGLAHALEQGLVHRDIKPQNLMLTPEGQVKVLDFGLASIGIEPAGEGGLTPVGQPMGTPDYIAPEQVRDAHSADTRADVYSLGCTLYFLLTGRPPFPEGNNSQKLAAHLERQPEPLPLLQPGLPPELVGVVERMMAKEPAARYQSPGEVVAAMSPFCEPPQGKDAPAQSRWWRSAAGLLLVLTGAVSLALLLRLRTEHGLLEISSGDADVTVAVKHLGKVVEIIDTRKKRTLELRTGAYELELREGDHSLELTSNQFTMTRDGKTIAVVKRVPADSGPDAPEKPVPPELSKLKPVFDDDFSDPRVSPFDPSKGKLPRFRDSKHGIDFLFEKGRFAVLLLPKPEMNLRESFSYTDQGYFEQIACRVTGKVTGRDRVSWRLLLIGQNEGRCLAINLWDKGEVEVTRTPQTGKDFAVPKVGLLRDPAIRPGNELNTLLVTLQARTLTIAVNGAALGEPIRLAEGLGPVTPGLGVCQVGSGEARGEFSRFTLWKLPAP